MSRNFGGPRYEGSSSASDIIPEYDAVVMAAVDGVDGFGASTETMLYPLGDVKGRLMKVEGSVDAVTVKVVVLGGMNVRLELGASANVPPKGPGERSMLDDKKVVYGMLRVAEDRS